MRVVRRGLAILLVALLMAVMQAVGPAATYACACGAMIPSDAEARASGELGLITWDGTTQAIDLSMVVQGSTKDAAWIMPAPKGAKVTLGEQGLFDRLADLTKPKVVERYRYWPKFGDGGDGASSGGAPRAGAGGGVQVEGRSTIGPFDVTTLAGTDGAAVTTWLTQHGYPARPEIVPTMQDYLDQGWRLLAVKLTGSGAALSGELSPLRLTFPSAQPVYPIRLSKHARLRQALVLYVAAPHRMHFAEGGSVNGRYATPYARWVDGRDVGGEAGERMFLTKFRAELNPARIDADFRFERGLDQETQEIRYVEVDRSWVVWLAFAGVLIAVSGMGAAVWLRLRRVQEPPVGNPA